MAEGAKRSQGTSLTARQREWLRHFRACQGSGESMKVYAARHGFSPQSFYQATKRLRACGALDRSARREPARAFVEVIGAPLRRTAEWSWRIRLAGGTVFESSTPLAPEELVSLLARLEGRG